MRSLLFHHWIQSWSWTCLEMCKLSLNSKHSHWEADSPFPNSSIIFRSTAASQVFRKIEVLEAFTSLHSYSQVSCSYREGFRCIPERNREKRSHFHVLWHNCMWKLPLYFQYGFVETESGDHPYSSTVLINSFRKIILKVLSKECDSYGTDCWKGGLGAGGTEPQAFTQQVEERRLLSGEQEKEGIWITSDLLTKLKIYKYFLNCFFHSLGFFIFYLTERFMEE